MKVSDLLKQLSYAELSNLSIGNEGAGTVKPEGISKIITHINDGLLRIYSRFLLSTKFLTLEQQDAVTIYHLRKKYAETENAVEFPYIKDLGGERFNDDVIRVLEVHNAFGYEYVLNDKDNILSLFTPAPQTIQIPYPEDTKALYIQYQARHSIIPDYDPGDENIWDLEIILPFSLEGALQSFVAYKIFSHMNGQEHMLKSQEHLGAYEGICADVEARDITLQTMHTSHTKLENRGFV